MMNLSNNKSNGTHDPGANPKPGNEAIGNLKTSVDRNSTISNNKKTERANF